ncbi:hypothetical protein TRIUR3_12297 [Triticum urartu]|uniref:Uncharacterized protein n=1 Tax=Triticum urartu TaxID=4572 RepID=M7YYU2_TRIUA|nr:hypothetical protein TRIUR3_12297 [Triticum urartu]
MSLQNIGQERPQYLRPRSISVRFMLSKSTICDRVEHTETGDDTSGKLISLARMYVTFNFNRVHQDLANDAVETVKGAAGEAGDKASEGADSVSKAAGDAAGKVQEAVEGAVEGAKDLGEKAKQATEEAWDATKDAAQGVADDVTAAVEDVSK